MSSVLAGVVVPSAVSLSVSQQSTKVSESRNNEEEG